MTKFFIDLYNYFERHKVLLYASLLLSLLFLGVMASRVKFEENVNPLLPRHQGCRICQPGVR